MVTLSDPTRAPGLICDVCGRPMVTRMCDWCDGQGCDQCGGQGGYYECVNPACDEAS